VSGGFFSPGATGWHPLSFQGSANLPDNPDVGGGSSFRINRRRYLTVVSSLARTVRRAAYSPDLAARHLQLHDRDQCPNVQE
jgi:hypothetical protein